MSTNRVQIADFARLLNDVGRPIYVLDDELTIVFLNRVALEWLGGEENILGRRCLYHSGPNAEQGDEIAARLCPPPKIFDGIPLTATVERRGDNGELSRRKAKFVPVGLEPEDLLCIVAVLEPFDLPSDYAEPECLEVERSEPTATALHLRIQQFRQEAAARFHADRIIGDGPAMRLARRQVELSASGWENVLLAGPQGSGRRHLASAIHYGSSLSFPKPTLPILMPLDCALLGPDLLEAVEAVVARERILHGPDSAATLLLHRVDETSTDLQAELADVFLRRRPAFRLLSTAAVPLVELSRRGKFRADLAAALSTIVIELPALADRRDDLPALAQMFLEAQNAAGGRQIGGFTPAASDLLDSYPWPGNIDELAEMVAEAYRQAAGREIDVRDLPDRIRLVVQAATVPKRTEETIVLKEYLGQVERELIRRALSRAKGNKARAARMLGMTRPRLYRRMVQLGLE